MNLRHGEGPGAVKVHEISTARRVWIGDSRSTAAVLAASALGRSRSRLANHLGTSAKAASGRGREKPLPAPSHLGSWARPVATEWLVTSRDRYVHGHDTVNADQRGHGSQTRLSGDVETRPLKLAAGMTAGETAPIRGRMTLATQSGSGGKVPDQRPSPQGISAASTFGCGGRLHRCDDVGLPEPIRRRGLAALFRSGESGPIVRAGWRGAEPLAGGTAA